MSLTMLIFIIDSLFGRDEMRGFEFFDGGVGENYGRKMMILEDSPIGMVVELLSDDPYFNPEDYNASSDIDSVCHCCGQYFCVYG